VAPPSALRGLLSLAALLTLVASGSAAPPRDLFDEIYARGRGVESSLKTVTARFVETTTTTMLSKPIVSRGTLAVVRPSKIALRYTDPETHIVLIDGDQMTMVWPSRAIEQRSNISAAQKRIDQYFVDKTPEELRRVFKISATIATDRTNAWKVTMDPRRGQVRRGLQRLHLWIDRPSAMLSAMQFDFPNGDRKLMTFSDVQVNSAVDPALFSTTFDR
jgi:outer membrane lipoprotein-sorting protein